VNQPSSLLRRAPYVVSYWDDDGRLIFDNYATGRRISADPVASTVLHFFDRWRSAKDAARHLSDFTPASVHKTVAALERHALLVRKSAKDNGHSSALASWQRDGWNPAAGFFHLSTKDVPYVDERSAADIIGATRTTPRPMPAIVKRYPSARVHRLPPIAAAGEYVDVLRARRTWRRFSRRKISSEQLSSLLKLTFGVQDWLKLGGGRRAPLKTAPSGGARHPIEAYVLVKAVEGVAPGIYHYVADRHQLELLRRDRRPRRVSRYLPTQVWFDDAAAAVFMTAVFARVQWRYKFARAYRVVLAESGHLCQNFCLTATWLGLAPFCSMALADSLIEQDLGIDGVSESVLYACGVGARPTRPGSPAWPDGRSR